MVSKARLSVALVCLIAMGPLFTVLAIFWRPFGYLFAADEAQISLYQQVSSRATGSLPWWAISRRDEPDDAAVFAELATHSNTLVPEQWAHMFAVRDLPCPVDISRIARHEPGVKLAAFAYDRIRGSSKLRGEMIAAAVSMLPGWQAYIAAGHMVPLPPGVVLDFCVVVKRQYTPIVDWCRDNAKVTYLDILDNKDALGDVLRNVSIKGGIDIILSNNDYLTDWVRRTNPQIAWGSKAGRPRAATLYHQHTNPGFITPSFRMDIDFICRVAVFESDPLHSPKHRAMDALRTLACAVPTVYSFVEYRQCQADGEPPNSTFIGEIICPDRSQHMVSTCKALDEQVRNRPPMPSLKPHGCFKDQVQYHDEPLFDYIDVTLVLGESGGKKVDHRPSTRLLHMMSHGLPSIFWKSYSYLEIAEEADYRLPSGRLPVIASDRMEGFDLILAEFAPGKVRRALREKGFATAAKYSALGVAKHLVHIHENPRGGKLKVHADVPLPPRASHSAFWQPRPLPQPSGPKAPSALPSNPRLKPLDEIPRAKSNALEELPLATQLDEVHIETGINPVDLSKYSDISSLRETLLSLPGIAVYATDNYEAREKAMVASSDLFSVNELPCAQTYDASTGWPTWPAGSRLAVFSYNKERGTSRMRGDMLAAAVSLFPGWEAVTLRDTEMPATSAPGASRLELCVAVKYIEPSLLAWCYKNGARTTYFDVLDNTKLLTSLANGAMLQPMVQVLLSADHNLTRVVNDANPPLPLSFGAAGRSRAATLYHQHANPGFMSPLFRLSLPFVCRMAVFRSSTAHSPSHARVKGLRSKVCKSPFLWAFSEFRVQTLPDESGTPVSTVTLMDEICPDRSEEMKRVCMAADAESLRRHQSSIDAKGCFQEQVMHHSSVEYDMVDLVLLEPERSRLVTYHRPSTRLMHWLSHGVPVTFWPFLSYIDVTQEGRYLLPNGEVPVYNTSGELVPIINMLAKSRARLSLRERGLAIAARYSALGVAKQLLNIHSQGRAEAR